MREVSFGTKLRRQKANDWFHLTFSRFLLLLLFWGAAARKRTRLASRQDKQQPSWFGLLVAVAVALTWIRIIGPVVTAQAPVTFWSGRTPQGRKKNNNNQKVVHDMYHSRSKLTTSPLAKRIWRDAKFSRTPTREIFVMPHYPTRFLSDP